MVDASSAMTKKLPLAIRVIAHPLYSGFRLYYQSPSRLQTQSK